MPQRSTRRATLAFVVVSGLVIVGAIVLWQSRNATVREPPSGASAALATTDDDAEAEVRAQAPLPDRRAFAKLMAQVEAGWSRAQLRELLGQPDEIYLRAEADRSHTGHEWWPYGVEQPGAFPMLGGVSFDSEGRVYYVAGGEGTPPSSELIAERELRRVLQFLSEVPTRQGSGYYPAQLIRAVNALQPLGKDRALAVIREYGRVVFVDKEGIFWVLRTLFEVPQDPGYMPRVGLGGFYPPEPVNLSSVPRFPLVIQDDIPLMLVRGYGLLGVSQPPEEHLAYFQEHGELRTKPLRPGGDPLGALERLEASPQWIYGARYEGTYSFGAERTFQAAPGDIAWIRRMIMDQLLHLVADVYPLPESGFGVILPFKNTEAHWQKAKSDVAKLKLRWDPKTNRYVSDLKK